MEGKGVLGLNDVSPNCVSMNCFRCGTLLAVAKFSVQWRCRAKQLGGVGQGGRVVGQGCSWSGGWGTGHHGYFLSD